MDNIIPLNTKRYLPHELKTRENAVITYRNSGDSSYVCRKYHISRTSLWRWNSKYDGTLESLMDKSHKPKSEHPNAHTPQEISRIKRLLKRNSHITINELWYKMKRKYLYKRSITSLYRIVQKLIKKKQENLINGTSKRKHDQEYHTPIVIGEKWQIDVKYVPKECKSSILPSDLNFYQYTCIDEATRERFLYWYEEHTPQNTVDFVKRCIEYYGYVPKEGARYLRRSNSIPMAVLGYLTPKEKRKRLESNIIELVA